MAKMYHIPSLSNVVHSASSRLAIKPGQAPINGDTLTTLLEVSYISTKFVWMVGSLYFCFYWTCTPCSSQVMVQVKNFLAKIYIVEIRSVISFCDVVFVVFVSWCKTSIGEIWQRWKWNRKWQTELQILFYHWGNTVQDRKIMYLISVIVLCSCN